MFDTTANYHRGMQREREQQHQAIVDEAQQPGYGNRS